jgi:hypothetical protein
LSEKKENRDRRRFAGRFRNSNQQGSDNKPGKKHLKGVSKKEQRQYEHIKESAQKSGRYGKRAKEVAARTVLKQHKKGTRKAAEADIRQRVAKMSIGKLAARPRLGRSKHWSVRGRGLRLVKWSTSPRSSQE